MAGTADDKTDDRQKAEFVRFHLTNRGPQPTFAVRLGFLVAMVDRMTEGQIRQLHTTFLLLDGAAMSR